MNKTLTERFLELLPTALQEGIPTTPHRRSQPRHKDEIEIEDNKEKMKQIWHPKDGFQVLKQDIADGMMYVVFSGKPIKNKDVLNMLMVAIAHTELFATAYQE